MSRKAKGQTTSLFQRPRVRQTAGHRYGGGWRAGGRTRAARHAGADRQRQRIAVARGYRAVPCSFAGSATERIWNLRSSPNWLGRSSSGPPSARGIGMRNTPAFFIASTRCIGRRRSRSISSRHSRIFGPSAIALARISSALSFFTCSRMSGLPRDCARRYYTRIFGPRFKLRYTRRLTLARFPPGFQSRALLRALQRVSLTSWQEIGSKQKAQLIDVVVPPAVAGANQGGSFTYLLGSSGSDGGSGVASTVFSFALSTRSITRRMVSSGMPPSGSNTIGQSKRGGGDRSSRPAQFRARENEKALFCSFAASRRGRKVRPQVKPHKSAAFSRGVFDGGYVFSEVRPRRTLLP
jgi:hypothetical protein